MATLFDSLPLPERVDALARAWRGAAIALKSHGRIQEAKRLDQCADELAMILDRPDQAKTVVEKFLLQKTPSFPDGAPQRELYENDIDHFVDVQTYAREWRQTYTCSCDRCQNTECPSYSTRHDARRPVKAFNEGPLNEN